MSMFETFFLSIIQGITEFLPISSTAHLMIFRKIIGVPQDRVFDIFLNLGTVFAVLLFYRNEVINLFVGFWSVICGKFCDKRELFICYFIASIPTLVAGCIINAYINFSLIENLLPINLILFAIVLYFCDSGLSIPHNKIITYKNALLIGVMQMLSLMPGVSRLGICFSVMRYLGFSRKQSFNYSMMLSLPPACAVCLLNIVKIFMGDIENLFDMQYVFIGSFATFICGLMFLSFIYKRMTKNVVLFIVSYRILIGILYKFCF